MFLPFFLLNMRMLSRRVIIRNTHTPIKERNTRSHDLTRVHFRIYLYLFGRYIIISMKLQMTVPFIVPNFWSFSFVLDFQDGGRDHMLMKTRELGGSFEVELRHGLCSSHSRVSCGENSIVTVLYNSVVTGGERFTAYR